MQVIKKINDDLAIAGQINSTHLKQIADEGYQSILNLRSPEEKDFWIDESTEAERLGLHYGNVPLSVTRITLPLITRILQQVDAFPKPLLVQCSSGERAAAIVLIYIAVRQGATLEQAFKQAENLGLFGTV